MKEGERERVDREKENEGIKFNVLNNTKWQCVFVSK